LGVTLGKGIYVGGGGADTRLKGGGGGALGFERDGGKGRRQEDLVNSWGGGENEKKAKRQARRVQQSGGHQGKSGNARRNGSLVGIKMDEGLLSMGLLTKKSPWLIGTLGKALRRTEMTRKGERRGWPGGKRVGEI